MISHLTEKQDKSPLYYLRIQPSIGLEQAWQALESLNIEVLYGSEEEETKQVEIVAVIPSLDVLKSFDWIISCIPYDLPKIDWQSQWALHGYNYQDGFVHVDLASFGGAQQTLKLLPGPGFGDLSHATTRLVLRLLTHYLNGQIILDIGCGSGILTLAALTLGASYAYGIDIDSEALEHAHQNACLNHLEKKCLFCLPSEFVWKQDTPPLILMNMIRSEQEIAWNSLPSLHTQKNLCLTSGIQQEERDIYLAQALAWGWSLEKEIQEDDWLAFVFRT